MPRFLLTNRIYQWLILGWITGVLSVAPSITTGQDQQSTLEQKLRSIPLSTLAQEAQKFGDPTRGALAFYQPTMNCGRCHDATDSNRRLGPDLTEKREATWEHLVESVLRPSAKIRDGFETAQVLTLDGQVLTGILVKETGDSLVLDQIEQPEKPLVIDLADVDDWKKTTASSMPEGLINQLPNRQAFLDLVSYLAAVAEGGSVVADSLRPAIAVAAPLPEYEARVDHAGLISALDRKALERGAETYRLRCASCHGTKDQEGSMPTSLRFAEGKFKHGSDPHTMYQTLTHGFGMMNPQRWMVPQQKYEVVHYIREHFLKSNNPSQYVAITPEYLADLPAGDTFGPAPVVSRPWTAMDYGPSLNNTIEVSRDGSNIAQKGIVIRLDDGPGGVESGQHWMLYEHDTLRVAAAWQGKFIDYEGIHFNGAHNRHPSVAGDIQFANPTGPGFARPVAPGGTQAQGDESFDARFQDDRVIGRDDKHYGPLPEDWARFEGLYRFGQSTVLKYRVGSTSVLETPGLTFAKDLPVYTRNLSIGQRDQPLILQVAKVNGVATIKGGNADQAQPIVSSITVLPAQNPMAKSDANPDSKRQAIKLDGNQYYQLDGKPFDFTEKPFSIYARIKTRSDGTILAKTRDQADWVSQGQSLFLRGGRPTFDIGWVGAVTANRKVNDGKFHEVVMNWSDGVVSFYIDGKPAGGGQLEAESPLASSVIRVGKTNDNFPGKSNFKGNISDLRFYQRTLNKDEIGNPAEIKNDNLIARWNHQVDGTLRSHPESKHDLIATSDRKIKQPAGLTATAKTSKPAAIRWIHNGENLRLIIPAGEPLDVAIAHGVVSSQQQADSLDVAIDALRTRDLKPLTQGGPANYPQSLTTEVLPGKPEGAFAVDVFPRPKSNPWNCRLRLTGIDFIPDRDIAVVSAWDGSVWMVEGMAAHRDVSLDQGSNPQPAPQTVTWRRFAYGLFQPLGVKVVAGKIFVICRDQLVALHDLNQDGEADWYENFNSDHQVTEHFHEFAAGLQTDDEGNFYYAKCARHAKPAIVPQHGTLLKIAADGRSTEILANGFRAPNGVCLNPDGSFFLTDQEGHWMPKNRINLVRKGSFHGNMLGYHDGISESDDAMEQPVCWITNAFDRSPSELLWVKSDRWGPLQGSLLNLSYGYGQIYVVPHEIVGDQAQGGMQQLPIPRFPTGIMRGRFHPNDGQLYCCGMFAWAGNQQQPGGLYRVRYTGLPMSVTTGLKAAGQEIRLSFAEPVDRATAADPENYRIEAWDLKRSAQYGSKHQRQRQLDVDSAKVSSDGKSVTLTVPDLAPTWGMEIRYSIKNADGSKAVGSIHNSIHRLDRP